MTLWPRKKSDRARAAAKGHRVIVAPAGDDWVVQLTGHWPDKGAALLVGRAVAAFLDLQFDWRGEDGRIQDADSSGDAPDPRNVPG